MEFKDLLNNSRRSDLMDYIANARQRYEEYLSKEVKLVKKFKEEQKSKKEFMESVKTIDREKLDKARDRLFSGEVCAVDGNKVSFVTLPNIHCRVGVVGVSYSKENKTIANESYLVSETIVPLSDEAVSNPIDFLKQVDEKRKNRSMNIYLSGFMLYKEREFALENRKEEWRMLHGTMMPIELIWSEEGLNLIRKIVDYKKVVSVISDTSNIALKAVGMLLEPGQYFIGVDKQKQIEERLLNLQRDRIQEERWKKFFASGLGEQILTGVYRVGIRSYVFETHKDFVEETVAILMADSMLQSEKGFPLLIDIADHYCSTYFAASEFKQMLSNNLLNLDIEDYGQELSERQMRE